MANIIEKLKRKYPQLEQEPMLDDLSSMMDMGEPEEEEEDLGAPAEEDLAAPLEDEEDMDMLAGAEEAPAKPLPKKLGRKMPR